MPILGTMFVWSFEIDELDLEKDVKIFFKKTGFPKIIRYFYIYLLLLFKSAFQNMLTVFCTLIFEDFGQALIRCKKNLCQSHVQLEDMFRLYERILFCRNCIENTFGECLFLLTFLGLLNVFGTTTVILGYDSGDWASLETISVMYSCVNFSILMCMMVFAAGVNEKDTSFRNAFSLHILQGRNRNFQNDPFLGITAFGNESITFSGWGYFRFTKGFILTAIGGLLTYSMLLNQFQIQN
ncbi:hypothetical protein NPIL_161831 [Nephila pilipes]|uniref:Gustatory receptor n=1 Tax=Nephila pilipes TaxID=299642 RepID=A0A8X6N1N7_NEPPI|nr:hypothetical protein NPIL_161831 [Nephila pilipes]